MTATSSVLRQHAEQQYASELHALIASDTRQRPPRWKMSPWAVAATGTWSGLTAAPGRSASSAAT